MIRYYCVKHPPGRRTVPTVGARIVSYRAYPERRYVPEIDRMAWGWVVYTRELTPQEISDYGLIREPREDE